MASKAFIYYFIIPIEEFKQTSMDAQPLEFDIQKELTHLIKQNFPKAPSTFTNMTSLVTDLEADSLDVVDFVLALEDTFEIEVLDEELEQLLTFGTLQSYVRTKLINKNKNQ